VGKRASNRPSETYNIIETLQHDHVIIKKKMKSLIDANYSPTTWTKIYYDFRRLLVDHIEKEDKHLYPFLVKKAIEYPEIAVVLDEFTSEISAISQLVKDLDEKIKNSSNYVAEDFEYLYVMITFRMVLEEETIFKDFGNVVKMIENYQGFSESSAEKF
jgi:hypothetical protein